MNEYKENVKYETFEQFWDDNYGEEYGYSDKYPSEPYYSIASYSWEMAENHDYYLEKAKKIIKGYMLFCKGETTHYKAIEKQAEQFLKE